MNQVFKKDDKYYVQISKDIDLDGPVDAVIDSLKEESKGLSDAYINSSIERCVWSYSDEIVTVLTGIREATEKEVAEYEKKQANIKAGRAKAAKKRSATLKAKKELEKQEALKIAKKEFPDLFK